LDLPRRCHRVRALDFPKVPIGERHLARQLTLNDSQDAELAAELDGVASTADSERPPLDRFVLIRDKLAPTCNQVDVLQK